MIGRTREEEEEGGKAPLRVRAVVWA
jgi:plasmid stability protein